MTDPAPEQQYRLEPLEPLAILAEGIRFALGPHHDLTGTCALCLSDAPEASLTLHLRPGQCAIVPGAAGEPTARITFSKETARLLVALKGAFDFRDPEVARRITHTGSDELVTSVLHSLLRPRGSTVRALQRAEVASSSSEAVARMSGLERVQAPPEAEVLERIAAGLPFVITGALGAWPAVGKSIEALIDAFGAVHFKAALADTAERFADFIDRARQRRGRATYTLGTVLPEALRGSFPPPYLEATKLSEPQLWMGAGADERRPVTPLHRDVLCGLLGQVHGRKRLTLYPPHHSQYLYPKSSYLSYQTCWVDPSKPDLERYPLFVQARSVEAVLAPGELLVQPAGWFHCVYSLSEFTMSVSNFIEP